MSDVRLTIITVTYNCDRWLQRTFDSVLSQNFKDYEYIVVDGQSTDKTLEIIENNIERFEGRLCYISEKDNGLYDAMNKGIALARGEYIGIINGDDYYTENTFSTIVDLLEREQAQIVYSDLLYSKEGKVDLQSLLPANHENLKIRMSVNHPTCFVERSVYKIYGCFDLSYRIVADYELMVRFYINGCKFAKADKVLAIMESGGISSNNRKSIREKYIVHKKYFGSVHAIKYSIKNTAIYYYRKYMKLGFNK